MERLFPCRDCAIKNPPMVILRDELWLSIANDSDYLCFRCIEKRLGRHITWADLAPCGLTKEMRLGLAIHKRSKK